ncbi:uncharacterized protein E0L32_003542 [Thyridium curvatum]|uniref:Uncharacterized protein n=1 Tax=Thyridium curvatum TaxID=1093900 RepID=A0A507BJZ0_9PEZI|nr:uncharacterized protein E0L32_003542 [Thyridium curvatum]TPX16980.1 hypothetical protein E0L32_003542 [Thyridium curvatum]
MRVLVAATINDPSGPSMVDLDPDGDVQYAILSHTWTGSEVLFADIVNGTGAEKPSFRKVRYTCLQAIADGLEYVWIDSCCIDKTSSAELSEAINSIYEWYLKAAVCYAHLESVARDARPADAESGFARCRWFTRGWTLQELLAPADLVFYSDDWARLGEKATLSRPIAAITGIDEAILTGRRPLRSASVAKRMSWAAQRRTTRPEDAAYCLMGVFGVNMPMLYGEGGRAAFLRLQEEVMKHSDDQSLFAWVDADASPGAQHGLLAPSPGAFVYSNSVIPYQDWDPRPPYSMTNRGLCIDLPLSRLEQQRDDGGGGNGDNGDGDDVYVAALDCPAPPDYEDSTFLAVYLRKLSAGSDQQYARVRAAQFAKVSRRGALQRVYVRQDPTARAAETEGVFPHHVLQLRAGPPAAMYRLVGTFVPPAPDDDGEGDGKDGKDGEAVAAAAAAAAKKLPVPPTPLPIMSSRAAAASRGWISGLTRTTFLARKASGLLAVGLLLLRADGERLVVLLGSAGKFEVGFDAVELPPVYVSGSDDGNKNNNKNNSNNPRIHTQGLGFEDLQRRFSPRPPGRQLELLCHRVDVAVLPMVHGSGKYYMIDLDVQACGSSSVTREVVDGLVDAYQSATGKKSQSEARGTSIWRRLINH